MRLLLIYLPLICFFYSCKKENIEDTAALGDIPEIELISFQPLNVIQFSDEIVFDIFYRDGNGDIGFEEADSLALFITDDRLQQREGFHIAPLSPVGNDIAIQGNLLFVLQNTILTDPDASMEEVKFDLQIKDRAGNWSNILQAGPITVLRE